MKDQNTIPDGETKKEKWNRGLDIFIESVIEPDPDLRSCAHNQKCYHGFYGCSGRCAKLSQDTSLALMNLSLQEVDHILKDFDVARAMSSHDVVVIARKRTNVHQEL